MTRNRLIHFSLALFETCKDMNILDEAVKSLKYVREVLDYENKLVLFFDSPLIMKENKKEVFKNIFKAKINKYVLYFCYLLIDYDVIKYIHKIYREFKHLYNHERGILEGKIYTCYELSDEILAKLSSVLEKKYKKPVEFRQVYNKSLIGGIKIILEDQIYDFSINTKLNNIKENVLTNLK